MAVNFNREVQVLSSLPLNSQQENPNQQFFQFLTENQSLFQVLAEEDPEYLM